MYAVTGITCLFSASLLNKIGIKVSMIYGCLCDFLWIILGIFPALKFANPKSNSLFLSDGFIYVSYILASALDGFGNAISSVASSTFISDCADKSNRGFYFSYFWMF
jgi:MFS family permease